MVRLWIEWPLRGGASKQAEAEEAKATKKAATVAKAKAKAKAKIAKAKAKAKAKIAKAKAQQQARPMTAQHHLHHTNAKTKRRASCLMMSKQGLGESQRRRQSQESQ